MTVISALRRLAFCSLLLLAWFAIGGCGGSAQSAFPGADSGDADRVEHDSGSTDTGVIGTDAHENDAGESTDTGGIATDAGKDTGPACSLPLAGVLTLPTTMVTGTLRGPSMNVTTSCTTDLGTQGPEAVYLLNVPARTGVILRTTAATNTVVAIRRICDDPVTEVACNNDGPTPPNAYLRAILDPGAYYVLVDVYAFGIGGDYSLSLETFTPAPNGTCAGATLVGDGAMVMGDLAISAPTPNPIACAGPPDAGNLLYYRATIPAGSKLVASAQGPMGEPFALDVLDACSASSCLAGGFGRVGYVNDGTAARDVIITVGSGPRPPPPPGGTQGPMPFVLNVSIQPLAANARCATARAVTPGTTVMGDTSYGGADTMTSCSGPVPGGTVSGPLWYSVTVAPGYALRVIATAIDPFAVVLGAVDGCAPGAVCLTPTAPMPPMPGPAQLRYANGGASAKTVVFYVGHMIFDQGGRFSMTVSIDMLASNGFCAMATPLIDGVAVNGDTTLGSTASIPCVNAASGVLYYSITVPAGMTLGVELQLTGQWDAHVAILDSCSLNSCLGPSDLGPVPNATFTNTSGAPRPVIVAATAGFSGGTFKLTAALRAPPANVTCAAATPVTNGTSLTFQDASAGADNLSSRCNSADTGGVLYYSATIGAGQLLAVSATATGRWLPSLRLLASCGATTCLAASSPMPMPFPTSSISYSNAGNAPVDVIIAVGPSAMFGGSGYFDLAVSITTP